MTQDYSSWFLKNYKHYDYFGEEAQNIKRRLGRLAERLTPPAHAEMLEVYSNFFRLYNSDIFSSKSKYIDGIRAKTADYYLMFRSSDNTPIPLAYMTLQGAVAEGDIKDAIIKERERKLKYFYDIIDYHTQTIDTVENLIEDAKGKFKESGSGATAWSYYILAFIFSSLFAILFVPSIRANFGVTDMQSWFIRGMAIALMALFVTLAHVGGRKYSYYANSKAILDRMDEFKYRIDKNISKLRKFESHDVRQAMRKSKQVKPIIRDTNYGVELRYFGTSIELIKLRLELGSKVAKAIFYITLLLATYLLSYTLLGLLDAKFDKEMIRYLVPLIPVGLNAFIGAFTLKRLRMYKMFLLLLLCAIISGAIALFMK